MKITKITITNYRSCVKTTFQPHRNLSALIGPNGSGKTNTMSAIRLLPALCFRTPTRYSLDKPSPAGNSLSIVKTWYEIDSKKLTHTAKLNLVNNEKNQDEIIDAEEFWYMPDFTGTRKNIDIPSWLILNILGESTIPGTSNLRTSQSWMEFTKKRGLDQKDVAILVELVKRVSSISYYSASQFTNPATCPISFEVEGDNKRRIGISITGHKKFLHDLYQEHRKGSESYKEFSEIVGNNGLNLIEEIHFQEIITSSSNYSVTVGGKVIKNERNNLLVVPSFQISGDKLSPSQLSEGTFKTLALGFLFSNR